ncbi:efflux RND transporter periplasmic adaptor subunit [Aurantimonas aggregata]|uniref:Efflux RND transporter periplasmic adaptor subunit n=1 Tax=Aurantimonas aggregata TaxID=2047720 RepID=A0A6L9MNR3_9HYPH|nr:efflux RND transporter periplasmic adaptor subunit [Aurantimonas aggregata]NDV89375.1 efflux RND transporter periplasmic adaptor subunit [Aurantimonas aggregata]
MLAWLVVGCTVAMPEERPPAVSVVTARASVLTDRVRVVGSLVAREESVVKVDLADVRIVAVEAEAGDIVQRGDVLARLDATLISIEQSANAARLARADAAIQQVESQIEDAALAHVQARADMERSKQLSAKGFAADETLELRQTTLKRAASALALAKQSFWVAQADRRVIIAEGQEIAARLARTVVKAPTDGRILRRAAKLGALTSANGEPLFVIAENGEIELDAEVPEADFARLAVGQAASIMVLGRGTPLEGRVRLLAPELQAGSRLGRARISLPQAGNLSVGAFARGEVDIERRGGVFLPATALSDRAGRVTAQVVEDGTVVVRILETGLRTAGLVEIGSGVEAGETVVLRAGNFLAEGDHVTPVGVDYPMSTSSERPILTSDAAQ